MYDMLVGFLRAVVPAVVAWMVAKNWIPAEMTSQMVTWIADFGAAGLALAAGIWSVLKNRKSSQIARVASMDEVDHVVLKKGHGFGRASTTLGSKVKVAA